MLQSTQSNQWFPGERPDHFGPVVQTCHWHRVGKRMKEVPLPPAVEAQRCVCLSPQSFECAEGFKIDFMGRSQESKPLQSSEWQYFKAMSEHNWLEGEPQHFSSLDAVFSGGCLLLGVPQILQSSRICTQSGIFDPSQSASWFRC